MISRKLFKVFVAQLMAVVWISQAPCNINNLKGTYNILKKEYKHLSLFNGAFANNFDYIMHLYDYGLFNNQRELTVILKDPKFYPLIKIVHALFHRESAATISRSDFVITKSFRDLAVATSIDDKRAPIIDAFATLIGNIQTGGKGVPEALIKQIPSKDFKPSFFEEAAKNEKNIFPQNTIITVLLAVLYRFCGDNLGDIKAFYQKLNEKISGGIFEDGVSVDNIVPFKTEDIAKYQDNVAKLNSESSLDDIAKNFEEIVYLVLLPGKYPPIVEYKSIAFENEEKEKIGFTDCMENAVRNIINILAYDSGKKLLTWETLNKNIEKTSLSQSVKEYYDNFSVSNVSDQAMHNEWSKRVSNIPFITYNRCKNNESVTVIRGEEKKAPWTLGYINIPDGAVSDDLNKYLTAKKYIFDKKLYLYEMMPTLRNVIILCNYLFGLHLFDAEAAGSENANIAKAFVNPEFVKMYFPKLCERLKIKYNWGNQENTIDKLDDTDHKTVETDLAFDPKFAQSQQSEFCLKTSNGEHAEIVVYAEAMVNPIHEKLNWLKKLDFGNLKKDNRLSMLPDLCCAVFGQALPFAVKTSILSPGESAQFFDKFAALTEQELFNILFWFPLNDPLCVIKLIEGFSDDKDVAFNFNKNSLGLLKLLFTDLVKPLTSEKVLRMYTVDISNKLITAKDTAIYLLSLCAVRSNKWDGTKGIEGFLDVKSAVSAVAGSAKAGNPKTAKIVKQLGAFLWDELNAKSKAEVEKIQLPAGSPAQANLKLVIDDLEARKQQKETKKTVVKKAAIKKQ